MDTLAADFSQLIDGMKHNLSFAFQIVSILWTVQVLNSMWGYKLSELGLVPRSLRGIPGIFISPFLHGDYNHIFFNSVPLFVLSDLLLLQGHKIFYFATLEIVIISGGLIWLFGKRAIYIGASSVIMGYFGYLLSQAYFQLNATTIILAILCLYYFGGLLLALFPSARQNVSWGGHIFGFLAGIITAFTLPNILANLGW